MNERLNFCTLFNSNYLSRGLLMYHSLQEHCSNFHLYVFAFDDHSCNYFRQEKFPHLTVISLNEFEDAELLRIKPGRTTVEYCWTCTPSTILYCIEKFNLPNCTYIDADLYFYSDPLVLYKEMGEKSVMITEHRYAPAYDQSAQSGIYCVQWVTFKNDENGIKVLKWWRNACINWCYARAEDGKFGDQKYLDGWRFQFEGVYVLKNQGGGLAPWNIQQYRFGMSNEKITCIEKKTGHAFIIVFYHFHGLKFFTDNTLLLTDNLYELSDTVVNIFYRPYLKKLNAARDEVLAKTASFNPHGVAAPSLHKPTGTAVLLNFYIKGLFQAFKTLVKNLSARNLKSRRNHYHYYKCDNFN